MTICGETLAAALEPEWPGAQVKDVRALPGGQWATMARVRLAGGPDPSVEDVVIRVVPDAAMGAKELAVQAAAADAGVRTPRVHLTGAAGGPLGGAWAVMDFVPGRHLLAGLDGAAALRRLPALVRELPGQLAEAMTAIHRIDPAPVEARVRKEAPGTALTVEEVWHHLHAATDQTGQLRVALERLRDTMPPQTCRVVCHGDLHPFNLLAGDDRQITVLDWTGTAIAPAAFDVAFTWLLLRNPPLDAPRALRPVIRACAAVLAGRFVRSYRRVNPTTDLRHVGWYAALHSARVLLDLHRWRRTDDARAARHPWRLVSAGAARAVHHATGVSV